MWPCSNRSQSLEYYMHVNEPASRELLRRLVQNITSNPFLRDDLFQEALIHLWLTESRRPGQTRSWYFHSCKFRLQHYLASGRSIDSIKRLDRLTSFEPELESEFNESVFPDPQESVLSCVCARELMRLLSVQLHGPEKAVLECLADGLGPREIGRRLNISHTMVIKHRCKIATLLTRLKDPPRHSLGLSDNVRERTVVTPQLID